MTDQPVPRPAGLDALLDHVAAHLSDTFTVLAEVAHERGLQDAKWGEQNHPNGTGSPAQRTLAAAARSVCQQVFAENNGDWAHVIMEEVREALAESDPAKLRAELVQVAAVAVAWIEAIDRRTAAGDAARP